MNNAHLNRGDAIHSSYNYDYWQELRAAAIISTVVGVVMSDS